MQYKLYSPADLNGETDVLLVGVFQDESVSNVLKVVSAESKPIDETTVENIARAATYGKFLGKSGQLLLLPTYAGDGLRNVLLYGLGPVSAYSLSSSRKMAANASKSFKSNPVKQVIVVLREGEKASATTGSANKNAAAETKDGAELKTTEPDANKPTNFVKLNEALSKEHVRAFAEGWTLGTFAFNKYKTSGDAKEVAEVETTLLFSGLTASAEQLQSDCTLGWSIAEATNSARQWIAEPPAFMTPGKLAEEAQAICDKHGMKCQIMDAADIEKLGMGSFLGVAKGAREPLKFIVMKYDAPNSKKTVGIIGKGITFDSGGLSLKPPASMEHMKYDMSGGAAIIAAMQVVGAFKPAVSVLGLVAATENMPGSAALHPGDVLKAMNGKTIEVNNTDAEGRLVLADAMVYAAQQGVDELIDLATLTGAIVTALGRAAAGIMGNNQPLIDNVIKYGARAGEKLWQMPMYDEYKESLKSDIADLKNAGARGEAGSSAAAMFLQEFLRWQAMGTLRHRGTWLDGETSRRAKQRWHRIWCPNPLLLFTRSLNSVLAENPKSIYPAIIKNARQINAWRFFLLIFR